MKNFLRFSLSTRLFILLLISLLGVSYNGHTQNSCSSPQRVCESYTFPASTVASSLGRLGCLGDARNPTYLFFEVATGGNATVQETNSNSVDVDFILLGPYNSITDMLAACGSLTTQRQESCSYSTSATENITFTNAVAGKFYLLLITNFSRAATNITLAKISGTATFKCCTLGLSTSVVNACAGASNGSITVTATNATGTVQYSKDGGINYQSGNVFTGLPGGTYDIVVRDDSRCVTHSSVTVANNSAVTAGTVGSNQTFCINGDPAAFTQSVAASGGNGTLAYQWQSSTDNVNFNSIAGATSSIYDAPAISQTTYYRRIVSSPNTTCASATGNVITVTVNPALTAGTISGDQAFCSSGDPAVITGTTPTGGNGTYAYQWQSSTDNATFTNITAATSASYDPQTITQTTYYRRVVNSTGSSCSAATSNIVTVTVNPTLTAGTISGDQTFCTSGDPAAFTQTAPAGGSGVYTYQWQSSTNNTTFTDITGATSSTYDASSISQTMYYRRVVSSTGSPCAAATSNTITVTVNPTLTAGTISGDQTFCASGDPVAFTQTAPTGGTGTYTYQWQSSTNNITFTDIAGATASTYDASSISQTTYYRRVVNSAGSACTAATSNTITVTVHPALTAGSIGSDQAFCAGGDPAAFTQTAPTGGSGTYTYQWQSSTDNTTFTDISGATNASYDAPFISQTTYYRRVVSSTGSPCASVNSNVVKITVDPALTAGTISGNQTFCVSGDPVAFTQTAATGGTGSYTYQWQSSTNNTTFTDISGATSSTYDAPTISQTTYYRRVVNSTGSACTAITSNTLTVTVSPALTAGAVGSDQVFCINGDPVAFTETTAATGGTGTYTYQWQSSANNTTFTDISGATNATYDAPSISQTTYYRRVVNSTGSACAAVNSGSIKVTINPALTAGTISGSQAFCSTGDPAAFTQTTPTGGTGSYTYQW